MTEFISLCVWSKSKGDGMKNTIFALRVASIISCLVISFLPTAIFPSLGFLFLPADWFLSNLIGNKSQETTPFLVAIMLIFDYAWFSWFVMAIAWAFDKRLPKYWPISGCIAGVLSVLLTSPLVLPVVLLLPSILLAISFCRFHLKHPHEPLQ